MSKNTPQNSTIHNIRLDSHFTTIVNDTAADAKLSWGAKGLLFYLLSRDANWKTHLWHLAEVYTGQKKGNKHDAVYGFIKELKENGYVKYTKKQNSEGQWEHRYDVYPVKAEDFQKKFPEPVKPAMDEPAVVNPAISPRTDLPRTDLPNKDIPQSSSSSPTLTPAHEKNDDACGADDDSKNKKEEKDLEPPIIYTKTNGQVESLSQKDLYYAFIKKPFQTPTIQEAVKRVNKLTTPINNIIKYIEQVCLTIEKEKTNPKKEKKEFLKEETKPKAKEKLVTFEDVNEKFW